MGIIFNNVSFGYNEQLLTDIHCHFDRGWTAVVGPNGCGKTTLLLLAAGKLAPTDGSITNTHTTYYCEQRTDTPPDHFEDFVFANDGLSNRLIGMLQIDTEWRGRWETLSHGERKRAQIATALWTRPEVLIIDEPTNHLDDHARTLLTRSLSEYGGIGLVVSHDRALLNTLPYQCLFLEHRQYVMRPGTYSQGKHEQSREKIHVRKQRKTIKKRISRLHAEASVRREKASRANKQRSKKGIAPKDHDSKSKIDLARLSGKDGVQGKLLNQLQGRIRQEEKKYNAIQATSRRTLRYSLSSATSGSKCIFTITEGSIIISGNHLYHDTLSVMSGERIALTGPNGCGKTTLLNHIIPQIKNRQVLYIPQEISLDGSRELLHSILDMPDQDKGRIFTVIGSLGSDPKKLMRSTSPSPGELRKLMLAQGILEDPHIIIMDEPTNHMDLPSVECLEKTLKNCKAALLLVSHDRFFLDAVTDTEWSITDDEASGSFKLIQKL